MTRVNCPSCGNKFNLEAKKCSLGDFFLCQECDAKLEIVWLEPLEVDFAFDEMLLYEEYDIP